MFNDIITNFSAVFIDDAEKNLTQNVVKPTESFESSAGSFCNKSSADASIRYPSTFDAATADEFAKFRTMVPFLKNNPVKEHKSNVFFNASSQVVTNTIIMDAITDFFSKRAISPDPEFIVFDDVVEQTRRLYAKLLGLTKPTAFKQVCFTRDSSEALHLLQATVNFEKGDSIVVLDNEFQHNNLSWLGFVKSYPELELQLKVIDTQCDKNFVLDAVNIAPYVDETTKVISLSCTMYQSGIKNDIRSITRKYNPQGVHTLVDLTQDVGFQEVDIISMGCSGAFFSTFKGLFIPQGLGILYMSESFLLSENTKVLPPFVNIKSLASFDPNELKVDSSYDLEGKLHNNALKYEHMCKPNLQIYASLFMLKYMLESLKMENVASYLSFLRGKMVSMLEKFDLVIYGNNDRIKKFCSSNIVVVQINNPEWMKFLRSNKCFVSQFRNIMRFSIGIYNSVDDIDALQELLAKGVNDGLPFNV